jgi:hypothetical protein
MTAFGYSSSCFPAKSFDELVTVTAASGGTCLDLRAQRAQAWEDERTIADLAKEMSISFVGTSIVLGSPLPTHQEDKRRLREATAAGVPIRCFVPTRLADPSVWADAVRAVKFLRSSYCDPALLVECHRSEPRVEVVVDFLEATGLGLLIDTLGLARLEVPPSEAGELASRYAGAIQVKGFVREDGTGWRHGPLGCAPEALELARTVILRAGDHVSATVETKSDTAAADLAVLIRTLPAVATAGAAGAGCGRQTRALSIVSDTEPSTAGGSGGQ